MVEKIVKKVKPDIITRLCFYLSFMHGTSMGTIFLFYLMLVTIRKVKPALELYFYLNRNSATNSANSNINDASTVKTLSLNESK